MVDIYRQMKREINFKKNADHIRFYQKGGTSINENYHEWV